MISLVRWCWRLKWALVVRLIALTLVRRWAIRRDSEVASIGQVGEQVTAVPLVSIFDWPILRKTHRSRPATVHRDSAMSSNFAHLYRS